MGNTIQVYGPEAVFDAEEQHPSSQPQPAPPTIQVVRSSLKKSNRLASTRPSRMLFTQVKMVSQIHKSKHEGIKTINAYTVGETIGVGLFGKVKKVTRIENGIEKQYAMKILKKNLMTKKKMYYKDEQGNMKTKDGFEFMHRQIAVYKKIRHVNLIRLYEVLLNEDPQQEKVYLVMELAEKGQLIDWDDDDECWKFNDESRQHNISEDQLRSIVRGCVKGLHHLHQNDIIHRDIKPQNILFSSNNEVKISDFGVSQLNSQLRVNQITGTDFFLAPESFQKEKTQLVNGKALDIWALGVTIYSYYHMKVPFIEESLEDLVEAITGKEPSYDEGMSPELLDLLKRMLNKNPNSRITVNQIALHPWVNKNCTDLAIELNSKIVNVTEEETRKSVNATILKSTKAVFPAQDINTPKASTLYESKVEDIFLRSQRLADGLQYVPLKKEPQQLQLQQSAVWPLSVGPTAKLQTQPVSERRTNQPYSETELLGSNNISSIPHIEPHLFSVEPNYARLQQYFEMALKRS